MKTICAWHPALWGKEKIIWGCPEEKEVVSHGICSVCNEYMKENPAEADRKINEYNRNQEAMTGGACRNCGAVGRWGSRGECPECRKIGDASENYKQNVMKEANNGRF